MRVLFDVGAVEAALAPLLVYEHPAVDLMPTIRTPNLAARAAHAKSLQSLLDDITATRNAVELLGEKLERLKRDLRCREVAVKAALAPVTSLPLKVLRRILLTTVARSPTSRTSLNLSHVNSNWRSLSLSTRELWTNIEVPSHCDGSEMFEEFAQRSGTLSLRVIRLGPGPESLYTVPLRINLSPTHGHRISSIELRSDVESEQWISSMESCATSMNLQDLTFTHDRTAVPVRYRIRGGMTSTGSLHVDGTSVVNDSGRLMNQLGILSVSNVFYAEISTILRSLFGAPVLRELRLSHITAGEQTWHIEPCGYDVSLTSLAIVSCHANLWWSLRRWSMPNLTSLTVVVSDVGAVTTSSWTDMVCR